MLFILVQQGKDSDYVIMYAIASGSVAEDGRDAHSPFAHALLAALDQKSMELLDTFRFVSTETAQRSYGKQTPWLSFSFNKHFHFDDRSHDMSLGILKILLFDTCRTDPFKEVRR